MPYKLTSFFTAYKALLASLFMGVYFYTEVAAGVIGGTWLVWVLPAVAAVCKVGV